MASNFEFLGKYWQDMAQMGKMAELYLHADANSCIYKIGLLAERLAQEICVFEKIELPEQTSHAERLRAMKYAQVLPKRIDDIFYTLRKARNDAVHEGLDSKERAGTLLQLVFNLCCWFMEVYGDWDFTPPEFSMPEDSTQSDDFVKLLQRQEERINALMSAVEEIRTAASETSDGSRTQKANQAAEGLSLTAEETDCLTADPVRLDLVVAPAVNYALQQNGAAAVQSVTIENTSDTELANVELEITSTPAFLLPFTWHIDSLPAHKTVTVSRPKLILDGAYLAGLTEKVTGIVHATLKAEEKTLGCDNEEMTVLAFDQWHGTGMYPELLASFVTPNHPRLAGVLSRAAEHLGKWTGDPSLDGYQSQDPNRVLSQAAAIFAAIKEQSVTYAVPPASFEQAGQRVRLCDAVLGQKLGTCLDLTLLYASCLEAAGLHPLLITTADHIFTGVWLEERMFPECVQDDVSLITKRLASGINEIAVVETTCVTAGKNHDFDSACRQGELNLTNRNVECIVDVHRTRMSGVSPLPQRIRNGEGWELRQNTPAREEKVSAPAKLRETVHVDTRFQESTLPKKVQWERKLLDLGMRNNLINLRLTKTQLPILSNSLDLLENALADGSDFTVLPKPADWRVEEFTFEALRDLSREDIVKAEFENKRLRSVLTEGELSKAMKGLYRTAKAALEENGANTLYLAMGMLRWYESKRSTKARYAPVILLPIEMVRKSAAQGYVIRLREEDPQMNITLLEKLKQDFGIQVKGLDPLPGDDRGVDIRKVLTILRKAVMDQNRWDVLETASIGIFSFSQFVMWNDIRNRADDLMRNKVVRSLMEGRLSWDAQPLEMGDRVEENNVLLPMPADASQLYAIEAACGGESFVLHGPPGTGKSQTITSLIANALAQDKSVLFVAEKMAALEVVQKRLESIGIGPFCLELHSNKSKKKDVLEQLRKAADVTKTRPAEEYTRKADQLAAARAELDGYARQLHTMLPCGSDLYTLINEYELVKDAAWIPAFAPSYIRTLTKPLLEQHRLVLERMVAAAGEIRHPKNHPLGRVGCTQYSQSLRSALVSTVEEYQKQLANMGDKAQRLTKALGLKNIDRVERLQRLNDTVSCMVRWYDMPQAWTQADFPQLYFEEVGKLARHSATANAMEAELLKTFTPAFLEQDGQALLGEYDQTAAKWFLPKMLGLNKLTKRIGGYAHNPVDKEQIRTHISALVEYQRESGICAELLRKYGADLGVFYQGKTTDWDRIRKLSEDAMEDAQSLCRIFGNYDALRKYCGREELREDICSLAGDMAAFLEAKNAFDSLLNIAPVQRDNWIQDQQDLCRTVLENAHVLKEWIAYNGAAREAEALGLANVVNGFENGGTIDAVMPSYKKALLQGLIADAIGQSEALDGFTGTVFNKKIEQYKQMDREWSRLSRQEVYCRLAGKVPNFTREAAHSSELGILQRCIRNGGRGTSIRKLFDQIPNLLPRLCPCMLMSPISAAQYLDPKRTPFDIVVFDEASQLPTCKAVGVLARGENAIIVGDPKQMPPTAFFATNTVDEDNLEAEDLESILDDCLALNMPQSHLLWHYRSRHESLIAFSNSRFYENKLFTFPSVNDRESKVRLVHVDGVFDRGKSRTNKAEAQAVVDEILKRFDDPVLSCQSIGVVTFNIAQQHLIDDMLTEACSKDPEFEKWVYNAEEPLFVKNLENVQGDERDVILFSIGFGPDENGKMYMNFGPLNREGGWRRLNVAVTRARCEMTVFSAMRPEQLDLNRTKAEGVAALRAFLEYAQGRALAVEDTQAAQEQSRYEGVALAICRKLKENGYETDLSVGRSQYRIDIGVVDPKNPDQYLLGIMLDGDSYGAAKTTRDREIAQISVLEGLGWQILRVWSMDWWDSSGKELSRILRHLQEVEKQARAPKPIAPPKRESVKLASNVSAQKPAKAVKAVYKEPPVYKAAKLTPRQVSAEDFLEPRNERSIRSRIEQVMREEAPVSLNVLTKRVVQSCGITRVGSRLQGHVVRILNTMGYQSTSQEDATVYWEKSQYPSLYSGFRTSGEGDNKREIRDVPVQEIANAVCTVLHEQISMEWDDLLRETAAKLGYTRLGSNVQAAVTQGIEYAREQELVNAGATGTLVLTEKGTDRAETTLKKF